MKTLPKPWLMRIAGAVCAFFVLYNGIYLPNRYNQRFVSDFAVFYAAGATITGKYDIQPSQIFNPPVFKPIVKKLRSEEGGTKFLYYPTAAILFAVLPLVNFAASYYLWIFFLPVFFIGAYYLSLRLFIQRYAWYDLRYSALLFALAFSGPMRQLILNAQINSILFFLLVLGFFYLLKRSKGSAIKSGLAFSLATIFKLYPVIFLPYLVLKKQWRAALSFLLWMVGLTGLGLLIFGGDGFHLFYDKVLMALTDDGVLPYQHTSNLYANLRIAVDHGSLSFLSDNSKTIMRVGKSVIRYASFAVAAAVGVVLFIYRKNMDGLHALFDYSLMILFLLIFSSSTHPQYHMWALPFLILLLTLPFKKKNALFIVIGFVCLILTQFYNFLPFAESTQLLLLPTTIGLIILFGVALFGRKNLEKRVII